MCSCLSIFKRTRRERTELCRWSLEAVSGHLHRQQSVKRVHRTDNRALHTGAEPDGAYLFQCRVRYSNDGLQQLNHLLLRFTLKYDQIPLNTQRGIIIYCRG